MKSIISFAAAVVLFFTTFVHAETKFAFGDIGIHHLDWNRRVEKKSTKRDFQLLELEGGALYDWGELYGFFDLENPGKPGSEVRTAGKGSINYFVGTSGLGLYAHVYNFAMAGFTEQNRVLGLGYTLIRDNFWIKPFIGFHDVTQTFYSGSNGYMLGWNAGYFFKVSGQKFLVADWHEHEFSRNRKYAAGNGARSGHNGAASLWWLATQHLTPGVQWRYAIDKLGTAGSNGAVIYSFKYIF